MLDHQSIILSSILMYSVRKIVQICPLRVANSSATHGAGRPTDVFQRSAAQQPVELVMGYMTSVWGLDRGCRSLQAKFSGTRGAVPGTEHKSTFRIVKPEATSSAFQITAKSGA